MQEEFHELVQTAMYKEIASEAFYRAGQQNTEDPGAKALMKELAEEESRHFRILQNIDKTDWRLEGPERENVHDLKISEYLTGPDKLEGVSLQDTLVFAMKREQHAAEFYSRMLEALQSDAARQLCERLVHEELKHKQRLETMYDELFYSGN